MTIMSLQSRQTPSVRAADFGRNNAVQVDLAQWTDHERQLNRIREDMMIEHWAKGIPAWMVNQGKYQVCHQHDTDTTDRNRQKVLDFLTRKHSVKQIATALNLHKGTAQKHLNSLLAEGLVKKISQGRERSGALRPYLWAKAQNNCTTDERILAALATPKPRYQLREEIAMSEQGLDAAMKRLKGKGLIVEAGTVPSRGNAGAHVKAWVRA